MNPLNKVTQSFENGTIPEETYDLILKRFSLVTNGIKRIENASSINYPIAYVEPSLTVSGNSNSLDIGILYARTIPLIVNKVIKIKLKEKNPICDII